MRLFICLIVLGLGISDVYAKPRFKTNPEYWNVLEGFVYPQELNTSPEVIAKNISKLVIADFIKIYNFCEKIGWKSDDLWEIGGRNYLSRSECNQIIRHFLLVVRQLQDAKFVAQYPGVICRKLRCGLKKHTNWGKVHKILQASTDIAPGHGVWQEHFRSITFLLSLIVKACDNAGGEPPVMQGPVLKSFYEQYSIHQNQYWTKLANSALEMEYLSGRIGQKKFRVFEKEIYNQIKENPDGFAYPTIIRLLSFRFILRRDKPYIRPSDDMVKLFLPCLKIEDLWFFYENAKDDWCKALARTQIENTEFQKLTIEGQTLEDWLKLIFDVVKRAGGNLDLARLDPFVFKGFKLQLKACLEDDARKQKFKELEKSDAYAELLFALSRDFLSRAENITLEDAQIIFELVEEETHDDRYDLYQAYFYRPLIFDTDALIYLLKHYLEQNDKNFFDGNCVFSGYLKALGRQWDAQTEVVLKLFDEVQGDLRHVYSSYFYHGCDRQGEAKFELNEDFTKALFRWITALDGERKLKILEHIFVVWDDFNAERFCQFYGWYLETEPPQEDINFIEDAFCRFYGSQRKCYLEKYEGMSKEPRANALLNKAKESYEKYWKAE